MIFKVRNLAVIVFFPMVCAAQVLFEDNFEDDLTGWEINNTEATEIINSKNPKQGKVLALKPNGKV
ncbi:MAG: hypothetical protein AAFZ89_15740, partial [Bacteroidota bacterium]